MAPALLTTTWLLLAASLPAIGARGAPDSRAIQAVPESEWQQNAAQQMPIAVRKMSAVDPGEKFWWDDWTFAGMGPRDDGNATCSRMDGVQATTDDSPAGPLQTTITLASPAIKAHGFSNRNASELLLDSRDLFARAFKCPTDTSACTAVAEQDLCCPNGQVCVQASNGVGCCPDGETCGDVVAPCDSSAGYTSCPNSSNGGCCVPGAACLDTGCVFYGTQTITTTLPTQTVTQSSTRAAASITLSSSMLSTMASVFTTTVTISGAGTTQTTTVISATTVIVVIGSSGTASAPVRPTSVDSSSSTTSVATTQSTSAANTQPTSAYTASFCPTGYYMCSAVYLGGCCQVGRDCHTTSCPPSATTSVLTTSGVTAIVATPSGLATACAAGWYLCASSADGGCCPFGYSCAVQSCVPTQSGIGPQAKESPSAASVSFAVSGLGSILCLLVGLISGTAMVAL